MRPLRLLKVSTWYPGVFDAVYRQSPHLTDASYDRQSDALMASCFGWADFWKLHLEPSGDYVVQEIILNAELLQKRWAAEHGLGTLGSNWRSEILQQQVAAFQPDIVFDDSSCTTVALRKQLKADNPSIKLFVAWDGVARHDLAKFEEVDLVLTCLDETADFFTRNGLPAHRVRLGFETSILDRLEARAPRYDISFVGGLALFPGGHYNRLELLGAVEKRIAMDLWVSGTDLGRAILGALPYVRAFDIPGAMHHLGALPSYVKLMRKSRGSVYGTQMFQVLADSRITLNSHINVAGTNAANMRMYEATGVGTCLVTDWRENLHEIFEPDVEVVTYRSPDEAVEKITYLLGHDEERKAIAAAGQRRTFENYSFKQLVGTSRSVIETEYRKRIR